jgi:hypothetical protein
MLFRLLLPVTKLSATAIAAGSLTALWTLGAQPQTVSPKISWQSLVLLKQKLRDESNAQQRAKIAKEILDVGVPLVAGSMTPSAAKAVADSRKSDRQLPEGQKDYVGFWLLRAVAAVEADNEPAGLEAANVLKQLGMAESNEPEETGVMALLNTKGWLDAPEPAEKQKLVDALKKGDLKTAATEADTLLQKYPQNAKLIATRDAIQSELRNTTAAGASPATAGATTSPESARVTNLTVEAMLKVNQDRWEASYAAHDTSVAQTLMANDYVEVYWDGKVMGKSRAIGQMEKDKDTYKSAVNEKLAVHIYGPSVAVVVGTAREKGTAKDGKPFDRTFRFTDTWVERNGQWQCVASHVMRLRG